MSMFKLLGIAWTAWKLASKRLGPVAGLVAAVVVVAAFVVVQNYLEEHYPALGEAAEKVV